MFLSTTCKNASLDAPTHLQAVVPWKQQSDAPVVLQAHQGGAPRVSRQKGREQLVTPPSAPAPTVCASVMPPAAYLSTLSMYTGSPRKARSNAATSCCCPGGRLTSSPVRTMARMTPTHTSRACIASRWAGVSAGGRRGDAAKRTCTLRCLWRGAHQRILTWRMYCSTSGSRRCLPSGTRLPGAMSASLPKKKPCGTRRRCTRVRV